MPARARHSPARSYRGLAQGSTTLLEAVVADRQHMVATLDGEGLGIGHQTAPVLPRNRRCRPCCPPRSAPAGLSSPSRHAERCARSRCRRQRRRGSLRSGLRRRETPAARVVDAGRIGGEKSGRNRIPVADAFDHAEAQPAEDQRSRLSPVRPAPGRRQCARPSR